MRASVAIADQQVIRLPSWCLTVSRQTNSLDMRILRLVRLSLKEVNAVLGDHELLSSWTLTGSIARQLSFKVFIVFALSLVLLTFFKGIIYVQKIFDTPWIGVSAQLNHVNLMCLVLRHGNWEFLGQFSWRSWLRVPEFISVHLGRILYLRMIFRLGAVWI